MAGTCTLTRCTLTLLALAASILAAHASTELSSNIITFYESELPSLCNSALSKARAQGGNRVSITPTLYWLDPSSQGTPGGCNPDNWQVPQHVGSYCSRADYSAGCAPITAASTAAFGAGMEACVREALKQGFSEVLIQPHLDDGSQTEHWRNFLDFDPLVPDANNNTYWAIMLQPILSGAAAAFKGQGGKRLWLSLQGEMGATIFFHPASWSDIAGRVRSGWASSGNDPGALKLGVALSSGNIPGVINHGPGTPGGLAPLPNSPNRLVGQDPTPLPFASWPRYGELSQALPAVKALMSDLDFWGFSNYPSRLPAFFSATDQLEVAIANADAELNAMGISIRSAKALLWTEFGIGGGLSRCGDIPANGPEAGAFTYLGIKTSYTRELDPWKNYLGANATVPTRDYMRSYYSYALTLLARGGGSYKVDGAFIWNLVSWDVQGIHPSSTDASGSYADPAVMETIRQHNLKYRAS